MRIFVIGSVPSQKQGDAFAHEYDLLRRSCKVLGEAIRMQGHTAILCSPFEDSADWSVLQGVAETSRGGATADIQMHFPDTPEVRRRIEELRATLGGKLSPIPYAPPKANSEEAGSYAWLLCQLAALDACDVAIAIGGKIDGAANMLLRLAEAKRKAVLPVAFLGGAARDAYGRQKYKLCDLLGEASTEALLSAESAPEFVALASRLVSSKGSTGRLSARRQQRFFISYPREQTTCADHLEVLLRRRDIVVTRDVSSFGAGHDVVARIQESVHSADVLVALWCREYACSPWCFDEMELALDRHERGALELWILRLDDTRIVPPRARNLVSYNTRSRQELEATVLELLGRKSADVSV